MVGCRRNTLAPRAPLNRLLYRPGLSLLSPSLLLVRASVVAEDQDAVLESGVLSSHRNRASRAFSRSARAASPDSSLRYSAGASASCGRPGLFFSAVIAGTACTSSPAACSLRLNSCLALRSSSSSPRTRSCSWSGDVLSSSTRSAGSVSAEILSSVLVLGIQISLPPLAISFSASSEARLASAASTKLSFCVFNPLIASNDWHFCRGVSIALSAAGASTHCSAGELVARAWKRGSENEKIVPLFATPNRDETQQLPPCASTKLLTRLRPSPVLAYLESASSSTLSNASQILASLSSATPIPVSSTSTTTVSLPVLFRIVIDPVFVNLIALPNRFVRIWLILLPSPSRIESPPRETLLRRTTFSHTSGCTIVHTLSDISLRSHLPCLTVKCPRLDDAASRMSSTKEFSRIAWFLTTRRRRCESSEISGAARTSSVNPTIPFNGVRNSCDIDANMRSCLRMTASKATRFSSGSSAL
mmetsp:Transcript_13758/g.27159  ORF Transcript_13758/g.27159 Transcript_13758/m.27159 type:complete len:475 (-) Transcript_13758:79-1503(-)